VESKNDFDTLARILGKLAGAGFYGNFKITIYSGLIVHMVKEQTFKADDLKKTLDSAA
jgi:hypothetical protein